MIVFPMLGKSSRFKNAGYTIPNFQLPLGCNTVFTYSVKSFQRYFKNVPFLFLVRSDNDSANFVAQEVARMEIKDYRIIQFNYETKGQAESVALGIADYDDEVPLIIFNIDTIRLNFEMPSKDKFADGFLEVFKAAGDAWSFVEPGSDDKVLRTSEKHRISDLCSNGLYGFAKCKYFRLAYEDYLRSKKQVNGEIYIAPLYNYLINHGFDIRYTLVENTDIKNCGIPKDYEQLKKEFM
jgi:dTDP-glucose pyrophosphorylase